MAPSIALTIFLWTLKISLVLIVARLSTRARKPKPSGNAKCIQIVVLGDIGRSPRMQYHAISFADARLHVQLVGYTTSKLHPGISARGNIKVVPLQPLPQFLTTKSRGLFLILGPLKVFFQLWSILDALYLRSTQAEWMLIKNPPAIPTLAISVFLCQLRQVRLVIDWHNLGFSILALKLGRGHPIVRLSEIYERFLSRFAYAHICVTHAMARYIHARFQISERVHTLCDRPASIFQPLDQKGRHDFLGALALCLDQLELSGRATGINNMRPSSSNTSRAARYAIETAQAGSRKLVVSPTSWTPDENFGLLLEALVAYHQPCESSLGTKLPDLLVIITGKGPDRERFEAQVRQLYHEGQLPQVEIMTAFFEDIEDYAKLLGSADLGISLHTSSSGIDLPMKVLDMFGAALPVAGWSAFEAWSELVQEGKNGLGFESANGLKRILEEVFANKSGTLRILQKGAAEEGNLRWDDEWRPVCQRVFDI